MSLNRTSSTSPNSSFDIASLNFFLSELGYKYILTITSSACVITNAMSIAVFADARLKGLTHDSLLL